MVRRLITNVLICTAMCLFGANAALAADAVVDGDRCLVLMLFDDKCKVFCKEVRPILAELKAEYGDRVAFHEIDFSEKIRKAAFETAKQLGVGSGAVGNMLDYIPVIAVYTPKRKLVKEVTGAKDKGSYVRFIESALKQANR